MRAATSQQVPEVIETTLLRLVQRLSATVHDDEEVVRIARRLLREARVQLTGSFRDAPTEAFV